MSRAVTADELDVESSGTNYINAEKGIISWLTTVDHKRIGVMYLMSTFSVFAVAGMFALLVRLQLLHSASQVAAGHTLITAPQYNQAFTLHGAMMVFLFIIPSIPGGVANFVLPIMIGAKDVAFPKLNLFSLYLYWTGAAFTASALVSTGLDTGWTFYVPYSTTVSQSSVIAVTFGAFILGFSSILTGLNFIVTLHKLRVPGMTWFRLPLFCWGIYATSIIQILATPVLAITLLLLILERTFHVGIFDPRLGGDPVLFQHFFWFYSHPAVYIMILPGMAIISDLIAVHSHRRIFGYKAIAFSSVAIALVGFMVWGHHMFTSGQSELSSTIFSFITFFVAVPSGVKVFNWTSTMWRGSVAWNTPMLYAMAFLFLFTIGGLTGLPLAMICLDLHLHDTYYVVAHFHYVMMGGAVIALIGGLHHWWPKITGKMYAETPAKIACGLIFVGFNMTFFTQFFLGARGMPRRYYTYLDQFQPLHAFSTYGSWVLGSGLVLVLITFIHSLFKGRKAPANPWGGRTLEWQTSSPPPTFNFDRTPIVTHGPYDFPSTGGGGHR